MNHIEEAAEWVNHLSKGDIENLLASADKYAPSFDITAMMTEINGCIDDDERLSGIRSLAVKLLQDAETRRWLRERGGAK